MIQSIQIQTDLNDFNALDTATIEISIPMKAESYQLENVTFRIALCEHEMPEDDGGYDEYLFYPMHNEHGQQYEINNQIELPQLIEGTRTIQFAVDIYGYKCNCINFLDIIKNVPDYILKRDQKLDLYVECIVNHELDSEESMHVIVPFPNPFYPFT